MCRWRFNELSCVVGILLHVLCCYVEMCALGALCPGGFVWGLATGLTYITGSTFNKRHSFGLFISLHLACVVDFIKM